MEATNHRRTRRDILKKGALITVASLLPAGAVSLGVYSYIDGHEIANEGMRYARSLTQPLPGFDAHSAFSASEEVAKSVEHLLRFSGRKSKFAGLIKDMVADDYENSRFVSNGRYVLTTTEAALQVLISEETLAAGRTS